MMMVRVYHLSMVVLDEEALNYDSDDTDDGSCIPFIYGCTTDNHNSDANTDDGHFVYHLSMVVQIHLCGTMMQMLTQMMALVYNSYLWLYR